jgi:hypothetical protein
LLLSTCEKDEELTTNLPQGFPAGCLLEKASLGSNFKIEYEFDENGLLLASDNSTYQRDVQGRVVRVNFPTSSGELWYYYEYEYEGSDEIPSRRNDYDIEDGSGVLVNYGIYESEGNKVLSIRSFSATGELSQTTTYEYDDEASQYTLRRYNVDGALDEKEVYTYNPERINPFYSIQDFPAYADTYALEKMEEFDASGAIDINRSYSFTYDIDENGRIINFQIIYLDGDTDNGSLIYECE